MVSLRGLRIQARVANEQGEAYTVEFEYKLNAPIVSNGQDLAIALMLEREVKAETLVKWVLPLLTKGATVVPMVTQHLRVELDENGVPRAAPNRKEEAEW